MRRSATFVALAAGALAACSLVTDLSDLGGADASEETAAGPCTGPDHACVPSAPAGWIGPFWIYYGDPTNVPTACPAETPSSVVAGRDTLLDASVQCGKPQCSPKCATPFNTFVVSCGAGTFPKFTAVDAGCFEGVTQLSPDASWGVTVPSPYVNACAFTYPVVDAGDFVWKAAMLGCAPDGSTPLACPSSEQCLATAPVPFETKPCIFKPGNDVSCPGAPYSQLRSLGNQPSSTLYSQAVPTCTTQGCGCAPGVSACTVDVDYVGVSPACGPSNAAYKSGDCITTSGSTYFHAVATPPSNATCSLPDGSPPCTSAASVALEDPFTVCCVP